MKLAFTVFCAILSLSCDCAKCMAFGYDLEGPPELRDALKCQIRLVTNNVTTGSRIGVVMTVENTATVDVQLPCPGTLEPGLHVQMFLLAGQATGDVQRLTIPDFVYQGSLTVDQTKMLEQPADRWPYIYVPTRWIAIPPHGREEFQVLVEIRPKTQDGKALAPGVYGLQGEIAYVMKSNTSAAYIRTNQWTSAERIAEAKASGQFLLDEGRLWTGRMESNVAQINVVESPR